MRRVNPFQISVATVVALGLAVAVAAALGSTRWAIALGGVALAAMAVALLLLERSTQKSARQTRRSVDQGTRVANRVLGDVRRVETLVDAMQRRLVASVESARIEAADRHRNSAPAK